LLIKNKVIRKAPPFTCATYNIATSPFLYYILYSLILKPILYLVF